jgi:nucleoside-diphosphate-sugar epimerase
MHILITGAAGMIGRKLVEQLIVDRALNGQPIEKLTLMDIVAPTRPAGFSDHVKVRTGDLADPAIAMRPVRAAGRHLPPRRRGSARPSSI